MSSLTKEEYSIKEFAELMKLDEEYVRQCCRGYTNSKGTKAKLQKDYSCTSPKGWTLKPKVSPLISKREDHSGYGEDPIFQVIKNLDTYRNFDQKVCNFMDIVVIKNHGKDIVLYNVIDHLKEPIRDTKFFLGDYLLYLLAKFLCEPSFDSNQNENGSEIFLDYFDLLQAWFNKASIRVNFEGESFIPVGNFCWHCGKRIKYKNQEKLVVGAQFCENEHAYAFYQETWRKTKSRGSYVSSEPIYWKLKKIQLDANELNSHDGLQAFKKECSDVVKLLESNLREKYLAGNHTNIMELDKHIGDVKMAIVEEHFQKMDLESWVNNRLIAPSFDKRPFKTLERLLNNSHYCLHEDGFTEYFYKKFGSKKGLKHRLESYLKNVNFKMKIYVIFLIKLKKFKKEISDCDELEIITKHILNTL